MAASRDLLLFYWYHYNWLGAVTVFILLAFLLICNFLGIRLLYKVCVTLCHFYFRFKICFGITTNAQCTRMSTENICFIYGGNRKK